MPAAAPEAPDQDPLPESKWFFRRIYTFAITVFICTVIWFAVERLGAIALVAPEVGIPAYIELVKLLLICLIIFGLNYLVAPSAEQIVKMVQVGRFLRGGGSISTYQGPPAQATYEGPDEPQKGPHPAADAAGLPESIR